MGADGTNVLMWALTEDDGYNDRDVVRCDIYRAILPDGSSIKVAEVGAGLSLYSETNTAVGSTQYIGYVVVAIDNAGLTSTPANGNRVLASGSGVDNDGDGMADDWETLYSLPPAGICEGGTGQPVSLPRQSGKAGSGSSTG